MNINYYILHVTNLFAMANIYIIWLIWWKNENCEEKGHPFSYFYNVDQWQTNLVCMCRSTTPFFKIAILPNTPLIWLMVWGICGKGLSFSHFYDIHHTKSNGNCHVIVDMIDQTRSWCHCRRWRTLYLLNKENLFIILTMKANAKC